MFVAFPRVDESVVILESMCNQLMNLVDELVCVFFQSEKVVFFQFPFECDAMSAVINLFVWMGDVGFLIDVCRCAVLGMAV